MAKIAVPDAIQREMTLWRNDMVPMPQSYIDFHKNLAELALEGLKAQGLEVLATSMQDSGWFDGMRELNVRAIQQVGKTEKVVYLVWMDSNQEFFIKLNCGGQCQFRINEFAEK